jgi:predicted SprT family Zn-dependent metalloprotease
MFNGINLTCFGGALEIPKLIWNSRLRASAGRFIPGSRKFPSLYPPRIEIASYLREEARCYELVYDTMAHEMIHLWLWVRRRPYGHSAEFLKKMNEMGVSRYNPVPRLRPYKYLYLCQNCEKSFPARKKLGTLACAACCKAHSKGRYDSRFKLVLSQALNRSELTKPAEEDL